MNSTSRVMLVTGASRGIGRAVAILAAERNYALCLNYCNDHKAADSLYRELSAVNAEVIMVQADISVEAGIDKLFSAVDQTWGRLDVLVNNAGVLSTSTRLEHFDYERVERIMRTNVIGAIICAREAVRRLSVHHGGYGGSIVNLSSRAAVLGSPNEYIDYAASKGAIDAMTIGLSKEVAGDGIRVNAVRPGLINTDIHAGAGDPGRVERLQSGVPMQRGGLASEVAEAVLWLASDEASYVTGTFIDVAGGR